MLAFNYDLRELKLETEVAEEIAMTSLGKLVFADTHSRQPKQSFSNDKNLNNSLSLAFENLFYMPYDIIETYATTVHTLDISHNKFSRNLHFLAEFDNLTSLNLDYNNIDDFTIFPYMPKLQLLWLNYNNVQDLYPFLKHLHASLPNLRYLCLMGNKGAPSYFNHGTFYDYLQYRLFVISWFPRLLHLDDRVITSDQRCEAKRLFKRPFLSELIDKTPFPNCLKSLHNKLTALFIKPLVMPDRLKSTKALNLII